MKVAKLEMKMITALFVLAYDFKLIDSSGKVPTSLPKPDRNDVHQVCALFDCRASTNLLYFRLVLLDSTTTLTTSVSLPDSWTLISTSLFNLNCALLYIDNTLSTIIKVRIDRSKSLSSRV